MSAESIGIGLMLGAAGVLILTMLGIPMFLVLATTWRDMTDTAKFVPARVFAGIMFFVMLATVVGICLLTYAGLHGDIR